MSAPTRQFRRLSIGQNMPEARAQSTRAAHMGQQDPRGQDEDDRGHDGDDDDSSEENESEDLEETSDEQDPTNPPTIQSQSGITYDLSNLDAEAGANALVGFRTQFEVVDCHASESGYEFQLLDRPLVRLGPSSPACTCSTFQNNPGVACQHIFWIFDQLYRCFVSTPSAQTSLSRDGHPRVSQRIEELLAGQLDAVAQQLKWQCLQVEGNSRHAGMTRASKVRDIFSAFSPKIFPEEFRQDLVETSDSRTAEQCVVQGDLEATMFRLAVHDASVFSSLCKAMPSGACAAIYFDKVQEQYRRLLADFDRYCATGERPSDPVSPGGGIVEVDEVVNQLRKIVASIKTNIKTRAPYGSEGAAKVLVNLLEAVAARNKDPLEGNTWGRSSFHGEDEDQRNIYHLLIGSEDMDLPADAELFVLNALETLHPAYLDLWSSDLRNAQSKIEVHRAPRVYLLRLGHLVRTAEAETAGRLAGSGQKRPAAGNGNSGGHTKRSR